MQTTANNLPKSQANSCASNGSSQFTGLDKYAQLKEPYKYEISCKDPWIWYLLWNQMNYFEEGVDNPGKTKVRFGRTRITVWVDAHYSVIMAALIDILQTHPELMTATRKAKEWLKWQTEDFEY